MKGLKAAGTGRWMCRTRACRLTSAPFCAIEKNSVCAMKRLDNCKGTSAGHSLNARQEPAGWKTICITGRKRRGWMNWFPIAELNRGYQ